MNQLPKKLHPMAKKMLQEIYLSPDKAQAERGIGRFGNVFEDKYPKAVKSLTKDAGELLTFYDFPAAHFQHIRTTNPIESSFSTIRLRTKKMRKCGNRKTTLAMMYELSQQVEKGRRKLRGFKEIQYVLEGNQYLNGSRMKNVVV
ncbi:MAG TPA: transposase [Atribacter sp.]|nr:transposase [Atribacter sp.]